MEGVLLTLAGMLFGALITHIYDRRSAKELQMIADNIASKFEALSKDVLEFAKNKQEDDPETSAKLLEIYQRHTGIEQGIFNNGDICPQCHKPTLEFINWGPGPYGQSNAWFGCNSCNYRFQTQESSCD